MSSQPHPDSRTSTYIQNDGSRLFVPTAPREDLPYSDGEAVERRLLEVVGGAADVSLHSAELAVAISDWPSRYHLSAGRAHLLRPLEHLLTGRTLEVGAGCGALTRFLGELGGDVIAVEGSRRRAEIAATRCRDLPNVSVFHDQFERFAYGERYSAITMVGVLEWAARFGDAVQGPRRLLAHAASLLDDHGVVIVAIENQLGLKYLAGWPEDHLGVALRGVDNAYAAGEPRTFGLGELTSLLSEAGLDHHAVFAPFPDYKLPRVIVSPIGLEHGPWSRDIAALVAATPVADPQAPVLPVFSLEQALELAARNGLLRGLANSFLVVAGKSPVGAVPDDAALAWHYSHTRRLTAEQETRFSRSARGRIDMRRRVIADASAPSGEARVRQRPSADDRFVPGELWLGRLGRILNRPGWAAADVAAWAAPWRDALAREARLHRPAPSAHIPPHLVDATPFNLVVSDGAFRFFDLEWEPQWQVEFGFALFRGVFWSLSRFRSVAPPAEGVSLMAADLSCAVLDALGTPVAPADRARYLAIEADFQHATTGASVADARHAIDRLSLQARIPLEAIAALAAEVETLTAHHAALGAERLALQAELDRLRDARMRDAQLHTEALDAASARHTADRDALDAEARRLREALETQAAEHTRVREADADAARRSQTETTARLLRQAELHERALAEVAAEHARETAALEDARTAIEQALRDELAAARLERDQEAEGHLDMAARVDSAEASRRQALERLRAAVSARHGRVRARSGHRAGDSPSVAHERPGNAPTRHRRPPAPAAANAGPRAPRASRRDRRPPGSDRLGRRTAGAQPAATRCAHAHARAPGAGGDDAGRPRADALGPRRRSSATAVVPRDARAAPRQRPPRHRVLPRPDSRAGHGQPRGAVPALGGRRGRTAAPAVRSAVVSRTLPRYRGTPADAALPARRGTRTARSPRALRHAVLHQPVERVRRARPDPARALPACRPPRQPVSAPAVRQQLLPAAASRPRGHPRQCAGALRPHRRKRGSGPASAVLDRTLPRAGDRPAGLEPPGALRARRRGRRPFAASPVRPVVLRVAAARRGGRRGERAHALSCVRRSRGREPAPALRRPLLPRAG
ncbi:MAG: hypothetical protein R2712_18935 [Vicinamibacterales bacterium]